VTSPTGFDEHGDERPVDLSGDEAWVDDEPALPPTTAEDSDVGWGEVRQGSAHPNDARLLAERPPHWD
jgi:hypothetical protein